MKLRRYALFGALLAACNSGAGAGNDAAVGADAQGGSDAASATEAAAPEASLEAAASVDAAAPEASATDAASAPAMNGCTAESFVDMSAGTATDRMIMPTRSGGLDMPCMTISAGQGVMFMWTFSSAPLSPGLAPGHESDPAGSTPNPIQMHSTGTTYTVPFPTPGSYPFYVPGRAMMLGVIQVR